MPTDQPGSNGPSRIFLTRKRIKITILILAVILVAIMIWQNWGPVDTTILFIKIRTQRVVFVAILLLVGFVIGLITPSIFRRGKKA